MALASATRKTLSALFFVVVVGCGEDATAPVPVHDVQAVLKVSPVTPLAGAAVEVTVTISNEGNVHERFRSGGGGNVGYSVKDASGTTVMWPAVSSTDISYLDLAPGEMHEVTFPVEMWSLHTGEPLAPGSYTVLGGLSEYSQQWPWGAVEITVLDQ